MRITAIMNLKGGVAKTTTVVNMAAILASKGKSVLVIDGDAQCNTTEILVGEVCCRAYATLADALRYENRMLVEIQETHVEGVSLIAGDESLMDLDLTKAEDGKVNLQCLSARKNLWTMMGFDYVLIDCPPAFSAATAAAMLAADDVIIPMKLDAFSVRGMSVLFRQIENMRQINPDLSVAGILPTMWYRSPVVDLIEKELFRASLPVFHRIRLSKTVDRMTLAQRPLQEISRNSGALRDYRCFVDQYMGKEVQ